MPQVVTYCAGFGLISINRLNPSIKPFVFKFCTITFVIVMHHLLHMTTNDSNTRKTLLHISTRIGTTLDANEVTVLLADGLSALIAYDLMAIYEADHVQHVFRPIVLKGEIANKQNKDWSIPFGKGIVGSIITSAKGENVKNAHLDKRAVYPAGVVLNEEQMIAIPLQIGSHCWGAFMLNRLSDRFFSEDEFETAQFLASYASLALNNIQLIKQIGEKTKTLRSLLDAVPDHPIKVDRVGKIIERTSYYGAHVHFLSDIFPSSVNDLYLRELAQSLSSQKPISFEFTTSEKDTIQFFEARVVPLNEKHALILTRDITQTKQTQAELRDTQALKQVIFDTLSDGVITINDKGFIIFSNEVTGKIFGYTTQELIGQKLEIIMPDYFKALHAKGFERYNQTGEKKLHSWTSLELPGLHKQGREIPLEISFGETFSNGRRIFSGILRDISSRKKNEENLKSTSTRLQNLIKTIQAGVLVEDENRHVVLCNDQFCQMFGIPAPADSLIGMDCSNAADQSKNLFTDPDFFVTRIQELLRAREIAVNEECELVNGKVYARDYVPIFIDNEYRGHLWLYRDVTETKQTQNDLLRAKQLAEVSMNAKQDFLAKMSHELRTPINGVLGLTNLMINSELSKENLEYLNGIRFSGEHLLSIINDILDLSKIEAGKLQIESVAFDAREVVDQLVQNLKVQAEAKNIALAIDWESAMPSTLLGDPLRLSQVLMNLLSNAIKFTPEGSVRISGKANVINEHTCELQFTVKDSGIGIPKEKLDIIFESFTQADQSTAVRFGGTGLGLTIVKQLVEMQGGKILLNSEVGKGSVFTIVIPYGRAEKTLRPASKETKTLVAFPGSKVLVVEDNLINQLVTKRTLENWQIEVVVANNGAEALRILREQQDFNLVIMDVQMPEMDGIEATKHIRNNFQEPVKSINILAMTASVLHDPRGRVIRAGMQDYISKPFQQSDLNFKLTQFLKVGDYANAQHPSKENRGYLQMDYLESISPGNTAFQVEMILIFEKQSKEFMQHAKVAFIKEDFEQLKKLAHAFKPQGAYVGINSLTAIVSKVEEAASLHEGAETIASLLAQIQIILDHAYMEIELIKNNQHTN
jgi:PAS domain S-box-containing protein